ncbi:MAG: alpha-E domain-containing protein [Planctomycetota bacterium]|nr:alpha-E domain-containing protein [Planctomycetota bacterium]
MLSRVAESIYWMNRYIERAENVARFLDVNHNLTLGDGEGLGRQWAPLVYTTGDEKSFQERYGDAEKKQVTHFLMFDKENPNSIFSCVAKARENARSVREIVPMPLWEQLNRFYLLVRGAANAANIADSVAEFCEQVKLASHTLLGLTYSTMSHGEPWHFSMLGRLIERADKTSRIVDVQYYLLLPNPREVGLTLDIVRWSSLLKSASALEMYRRTHGRIEPHKVADFLILDRFFPRSVHFCLVHAQESLRAIVDGPPGTQISPSGELIEQLRLNTDRVPIENIIQRGIHEFIDEIQVRLNRLGDAITAEFFALTPSTGTDLSSQQQSITT